MKTITEHLAQYASYHRNKRNIATHLVGIPLIVVAILTLLSRPEFVIAGVLLSPAVLITLAAVVYYVRLDAALGILMALLLALALWAGQSVAAMATATWLIMGIGIFVIGWVFQFVGHFYEGRKPAFVDDIMGLVIGPLFVVAEVVFMIGLRKSLYNQVEQRVEEIMREIPPARSHTAT